MGDVSSLGFFFNFFKLYSRVCMHDVCVSVLSHTELRKQPSGVVPCRPLCGFQDCTQVIKLAWQVPCPLSSLAGSNSRLSLDYRFSA